MGQCLGCGGNCHSWMHGSYVYGCKKKEEDKKMMYDEECDLPPAVKPSVVAKLTPAPRHVVEEINVFLSKAWSPYERSGGRCFAVNKIGTVCLEWVENYYRKAGWVVNYVSDQRDGDYLNFKAPIGDLSD